MSINWAARIKWAFLKECSDEVSWKKRAVYYFLKFESSFNTGGSINTAGSIYTMTLKSVILFLFDFKKSSSLGEKDSHFCLVYGKVY